MKIVYIALLGAVVVLSWGFVDPNFPYQPFPDYFRFLHEARGLTTAMYIGLLVSLFAFYLVFLRLGHKEIWGYIKLTIIILFFAYPAFSSDIFNYIATAKVTYQYLENPYVVMPNEIGAEPMLAYLHASNKVALYGPTWIGLTSLPHYLGFGNIILTMIVMKTLVLLFFLWLVRLLERISPSSVAFFALNPLVIMETFANVHQDVVMMALALYALILLHQKRYGKSILFLVLSIFIKGATLFLVPVYILAMFGKIKNIWYWSTISMLVIFLLSPIREEMYPWYFIWVLTFASLLPRTSVWTIGSIALSFGLELRIAPYLYTWRWDGITPMAKRLVTLVPPALIGFLYGFRKKN